MKVKLYALTYKVANYKKTCSDHNAFIFNMYMKINKKKQKKTIVTKIKHNGDLKNLNKLQKIQQYLIIVLHNSQIHSSFKNNMTNGKRN